MNHYNVIRDPKTRRFQVRKTVERIGRLTVEVILQPTFHKSGFPRRKEAEVLALWMNRAEAEEYPPLEA